MRTQKVRQSPRRIRSDPIGSAINSRTVRQKVRQKSPPMSANVRQRHFDQCPPESAADNYPPRTVVRRGQSPQKFFEKKIFIEIILGGQSSADGQLFAADSVRHSRTNVRHSRTNMSAAPGQICQPLADKHVRRSRMNVRRSRTNVCQSQTRMKFLM